MRKEEIYFSLCALTVISHLICYLIIVPPSFTLTHTPNAPGASQFFFPLFARISSKLPFSRSVILWWRDVRVDSTLPRCSVSLRSPGFPSSMLFTRDNTCFSRSSILLWSRSLRLFACTELLLLLNCCQGGKDAFNNEF